MCAGQCEWSLDKRQAESGRRCGVWRGVERVCAVRVGERLFKSKLRSLSHETLPCGEKHRPEIRMGAARTRRTAARKQCRLRPVDPLQH